MHVQQWKNVHAAIHSTTVKEDANLVFLTCNMSICRNIIAGNVRNFTVGRFSLIYSKNKKMLSFKTRLLVASQFMLS